MPRGYRAVSTRRSGAEGEASCDCLVEHAVGDLLREAEDLIGLLDGVGGEPALRRDDGLGAQAHRIATASDELAPDRGQRAPVAVDAVGPRAVGRDRAPCD